MQRGFLCHSLHFECIGKIQSWPLEHLALKLTDLAAGLFSLPLRPHQDALPVTPKGSKGACFLLLTLDGCGGG